MLATDHTVLSGAHKVNPLPIPLGVGDWDSLDGWLYINKVCRRTVTHLSTNQGRRRYVDMYTATISRPSRHSVVSY